MPTGKYWKRSLTWQKKPRKFCNLLEIHKKVYSLCEKTITYFHVQAQLESKDRMPLCVKPYAIKEEQKTAIEKEIARLDRLGIL